jgi:hypothetical protein
VISSRYLTLGQAAARLQWSVRYLKSRLIAHSISPIGRGRAARLSEHDLELLEAKERHPCRTSSCLPDGADHTGISGAQTRKAVSNIRLGKALAVELRRGRRNFSSDGPVVAFPARASR